MGNKATETKNGESNNKEILLITLVKNGDKIINETLLSFVEKINPVTKNFNKLPMINLVPEN